MKCNVKNKIKDFLMIFIGAIILFLFLFIPLYFFGGAIFAFLGLKYSSFLSLAKFFIILFLIYTPIDFVVDCFFKVLIEFHENNTKLYNNLYSLLSIFIMFFIIEVIDIFMKNISCPSLTAFMFSIIFYLFVYFIDKKSSSTLDDEN